ncbi:MAG: SDR family NAD(P)-dependent oxidoreductase [Acidimicrobiales bacterium]|jgi:NAD(P)-dependent dehydrogenase (short-subunit alcohol dehydrogenase family)|nr:SDR family NAD(P)-dependent oxidoreductase [Acidimicrobiales bacterium]
MTVRTALVTGASRGIGRATALAFASAGFDVAITARTVRDGDPTARTADPAVTLPGSLESTAAEIESLGRRAVTVPLDLLDRDALVPAVGAAVEGLGHLDVVVNNAIYVSAQGPRPFLETDPDDIVNQVWGDLTAQLLLLQPVVAHMVERGGGTVVNIGSGSGRYKLRRPIGKGGSALTYAAVKAGFHRVADRLANEYGHAGIRAYTVDPGYVATERTLLVAGLSDVASRGVDPSIVGEAIAWLVDDEAAENGSYHEAQDIARALGLLPPTDQPSTS